MEEEDRTASETVLSATAKVILFVVTALALSGCNSSAKVGTTTPEQSPGTVLRSDQFLAAVANDDIWVAVGTNGVVVSGDRNGPARKRHVLPGTVSLLGIAVCPDSSFVALDFYRRVWTGDPSGDAWTSREIKTTAVPLALTCDSRGRYWVVGSGTTILHSKDSGATWAEKNQGEDAQFSSIQFVDADFGIIAGEFGTVLTTQDGGASWQKQPAISPDFYPYAVLFSSREKGWIAGAAGALMQTRDGGKIWVKQQNDARVSMYGLATHDGGVVALGDNGRMVRLDGDHWATLEHGQPVFSFLRSAVSLGPRRVLIAGGAGALYTITVRSETN